MATLVAVAVLGAASMVGEAVAEAVSGLSGEEGADGFFVTAVEKAFDTGVRNMRPGGCAFRTHRKMKAMDGVEEEESADAVVEAFAGVAAGFEVFGFGDQSCG